MTKQTEKNIINETLSGWWIKSPLDSQALNAQWPKFIQTTRQENSKTSYCRSTINNQSNLKTIANIKISPELICVELEFKFCEKIHSHLIHHVFSFNCSFIWSGNASQSVYRNAFTLHNIWDRIQIYSSSSQKIKNLTIQLKNIFYKNYYYKSKLIVLISKLGFIPFFLQAQNKVIGLKALKKPWIN